MMPRGSDENVFSTDTPEYSNRRRLPNQNFAIDPALLVTQDGTTTRPQYSGDSYRRPISESSHRNRQRAPGFLPSSQTDFQGANAQMPFGSNIARIPEPTRYHSILGYPLSGPSDRGNLRGRNLQSYPVPDSRPSPSIPEAQPEADTFEPNISSQRVTQSSRKRTSADAGFVSAEAEDNLEDATFESQTSTRRSKRTKTSPKNNETGDKDERRVRKISKLKLKITQGRAPKKGALGPNGEVRTREDGRMEFRDADNPEWTLAAYHNDYRRQFIDEAAEHGEFDHPAARGEAEEDETSYEPEQQNWGPSREDWQNIIDPQGKKVMFAVDKPESRRPSQEPAYLTRDGLVLLDLRNHPIKDWPGLNKTLSTEIESWRWEALIRMYPWVSVTDLLARMPRTRKSKGRVLPLQTPQAFTNRAYRLRLPNQIPASHPKNGSKAIKAEIVKNLAKGSLKTTEALSILDQDQIDRIRRANKGKFKENSRYIVNKNQAPTMCPEDIDFESEEAMPKAKRPCIRPHQTLEGEVQGPKDTALGSIYDDNKDAEWDFYDEITGTSPATDHHEQVNIPSNIGGSMSIQAQEDLVPLFATIEDQGLALIMDKTFASPGVVIQARRNGNQQTRQIGVYWYSPGIPRYEWPDGTVMESVVHGAFWNQIEAVEHVPGDTQLMSQDDRTNNGAPCFMQGNIPPAFDPMFNPLFDASSHQGYQGFPEQVPRTTAYPILQTPLSIPNYTGRYQTQSDSADEVWRDGYGSSGF